MLAGMVQVIEAPTDAPKSVKIGVGCHTHVAFELRRYSP